MRKTPNLTFFLILRFFPSVVCHLKPTKMADKKRKLMQMNLNKTIPRGLRKHKCAYFSILENRVQIPYFLLVSVDFRIIIENNIKIRNKKKRFLFYQQAIVRFADWSSLGITVRMNSLLTLFTFRSYHYRYQFFLTDISGRPDLFLSAVL